METFAIAVLLALCGVYYFGVWRPAGVLARWAESLSRGDGAIVVPAIHSRVPTIRRLACSLETLNERLQGLQRARSRSKDEFLATVSHELKNPLAALKEGMSLLVNRADSLAPDVRSKSIAACFIASKRLEVMINNLVSDSGYRNLSLGEAEMKLTDIREVLRTALIEVGPLARKKKMNLSLHAAEGLRAPVQQDAMLQVVENLLVNAIKYGDESTPIGVVAGVNGPWIELRISNVGTKIGDCENERVFERFFRGSNARSQGGLGLGLHVVKKIVEAHHGVVDAKFSEGRAVVSVRIPQGAVAV